MASAQVAGAYRIYIIKPDGSRKQVAVGSNYFFSPGGSADGAVANTPEKWNYLPDNGVRGGSGYLLQITLQSGAAKTIDASDCFMNIPIVVNGAKEILGNSAHATGIMNNNFSVVTAAADIAYVAGVETPVLTYRANEGVVFGVGGDRVNLSIEDNTA